VEEGKGTNVRYQPEKHRTDAKGVGNAKESGDCDFFKVADILLLIGQAVEDIFKRV